MQIPILVKFFLTLHLGS